jgi:hypothetical protein
MYTLVVIVHGKLTIVGSCNIDDYEIILSVLAVTSRIIYFPGVLIND